MAEAYDVALAPHCPLGPIGTFAACLQIDAVSHNAFIQEQSLGIHYNKGNDILDYISNKEVFHYADGFVSIPRRDLASASRWTRPMSSSGRRKAIAGAAPCGVMRTAAWRSGEETSAFDRACRHARQEITLGDEVEHEKWERSEHAHRHHLVPFEGMLAHQKLDADRHGSGGPSIWSA